MSSIFKQVIARTSAEERATLSAAGFVHVTGLYYKMGDSPFLGEELQPAQLGTSSTDTENNSYGQGEILTTVIVTMGGEIWVRRESKLSSAKSMILVGETVTRFASRGKGRSIPQLYGLRSQDVFMRIADPDYEPVARER